jgi:tryptophan-rich sensory protein
MSWLIALGIIIVAAVVEGLLSGSKPMVFLASLDQPRWSLPAPAWIAVGIGFYIIMLVALVRMLEAGTAGWLPVGLIVVGLAANGLWNFVLFRRHRLDWAYLFLFPYAAVVALAWVSILSVDLLAAGPIGLYLLFLIYDFAWARSLRNRNPAFSRAPS